MRKFLLLFWIILFCNKLNAQGTNENMTGQISFISSQNVYVKFKSTAGILEGDTIYLSLNGGIIPALKVNNLSSTSCICSVISSSNLTIGEHVIAKAKISPAKTDLKVVEKIAKESLVKETPPVSTPKPEETKEVKQNKIKGSISVNSYSDFSNTLAKNSERLRYTFSLDGRNINNSKFSVESYISFNHKIGEWDVVKSDIFNALKIYNLSVTYDPNKTTQISFGRKMNLRISSIGAIDGLQVEKTVNKFILGGIVGTRPDYFNYSFNAKLLQFGSYLAFNTKGESTYSESSIALMQQMNGSKTDRRFVYLQHSNSIVKNLYFFSTLEVDLYKLKIDTTNNTEHPQNTFNPVGFYLSLRYKVTKKITVTGSYDARKNIIYYETYKTFIDRILETELRQGFRLQANYRITRDLMFGIQSGYRYLKSDPKPTKNAYSYLTYNQIPWLNISATLSGTYLESNYMQGEIVGLNITRDFFKGSVQSSIGYRYVNYNLPANQKDIKQNIGEMSLSWQITRTTFLSINYEGTFENQDRYNRFYLQFRKRF